MEVIKNSHIYSPQDFLGRHIIAEFFDADYDALNNAKELLEAMKKAAETAGATVLSGHEHRFEPHGVSAVVIIQESNLCIHTWPEANYAAADFFTCGDTVNPWVSFDDLKVFLKSKRFHCMELQRGCTQLMDKTKRLTIGQVQTALNVSGVDGHATKVTSQAI